LKRRLEAGAGCRQVADDHQSGRDADAGLQDRAKGEGGTVLKTSLDHTKEEALKAALAGVQAAVPAAAA
jgi:hypothetical protein